MKDYNALIKYIESVKDKPHDWGKHNCCIFCNEGMKAFLNEDFMPEMISKYYDLQSAIKAIRSTKSKTLYHNLVNIFGKPIHISKASRGNIIYKSDGLEGPSIGICWGEITYFVGINGLVEEETRKCKLAWAR